MSKLFEHIKAYETRNRTYVQKPLRMVDWKEETYDLKYGGEATVYRFEARLGAQVAVTDATKDAINWETLMKHRVYLPLAEEVFGEYRQPLIEAEFAIHQGQNEAAVKLIRGVIDSMFNP